ncbi:hypothetical protein [Actinomadura litoris]|uniref:hypothetical protein n=1 Tax=Actinomadura litoris TaxID=2678616 RepID=UPI001FA7400A|nr:hypothetical protein [Actinomadura litoris]
MADDSTFTPLAALASALQGRGIEGELVPALELEPAADQEAQPCDTVTCKPRPSDEGRLWFFGGDRKPIAQADDITEAVMVIRANRLRGSAFGITRGWQEQQDGPR